jgi:hypothetical protein
MTIASPERISPPNKARPQCRSRQEWSAASRGRGFVSYTNGRASWQLATLLNDLCASLVDQPMVQLHRCETWLQQRSTTIIKRSDAPTSWKTKNAEM